MKHTKEVKKLIRDLYIRGIWDGEDIQRGNHDRFMGNREDRIIYETGLLADVYKKIRLLVK